MRFCSEEELEDSLGASTGFNNRPYREDHADSGDSSADLIRLKEADARRNNGGSTLV